MITITPKNIREISQDLQCGLRCFYNTVNEEIKSHPDFMSDAYAEPEMWQEMLDEIAENSDQYIEFEKLPTRESFEMMETFVDTVKDKRLQNSLINALNRPKPFRNFHNRLDDSDYREAWFKFKDQFTKIGFVSNLIGLILACSWMSNRFCSCILPHHKGLKGKNAKFTKKPCRPCVLSFVHLVVKWKYMFFLNEL